MKDMTLRLVAAACGGTLYGEVNDTKEITGVVIDSRLVQPGNLFIATKGERVDGHQFIPAVFSNGCMAVVCETLPEHLPGPCIQVKNSIQALQDIAAYYRSRLTIPVIGITGSVGKTSTKEFIAGVLGEKYKVWKTQGNFNNEIGMSLTILGIREEHEIAVLEMGISHFGEMHELSKIARPDICVMTNIGQCHLEYLGDRDGILRAKSEIFDYMKEEGTVCLNGDDDKLRTIQAVHGETPVFFGRQSENDIVATNIKNNGLFGSEAVIEIKKDGAVWKQIPVTIHLPGEHMVDNALAATTVGLRLSLSPEEIQAGIESVEPVAGRSNLIQSGSRVLIDDCYNANPVSMKAALELLGTAKSRKVAILGDMFELGEQERQMHAGVGTYAVHAGIDLIICVGILSKSMYDAAIEEQTQNKTECQVIWYETKQELLAHIQELLTEDDTVLIKASHGMGFTEIVDILK